MMDWIIWLLLIDYVDWGWERRNWLDWLEVSRLLKEEFLGGFRVDLDVKQLKEINKFKIKNKYINNKKIEQYKTIYISLCFLF